MNTQQLNWASEKIGVEIAYTERQLKKDFRWMSASRGAERPDTMKEVAAAIAEIEQAEKLSSNNIFTVIGAFYDNPTPEAAEIILCTPMNVIYNRPFKGVPQVIENLFNAAEAIAQPLNFTKAEAREAIEKMPPASAFFYALGKHMGK